MDILFAFLVGIGGDVMKVERELVAKAALGDKEAFEKLYYSCYKDFYNFALYTLGNPDDAADIVSETFVEILKGIGNLREPGAFATWAFKILSVKCKKEISNSIKRRGEFDFDELIEMPFSASEHFEEDISEKASLAAALSKLDGEERMILVLSVLHGYTRREIAEMIGKPQGTVASKLYRTYEKLRKMMNKE